MSNKHESLKSLFDDIADKIRSKDGTSADIIADTFPERIAAIKTDPSGDANAVASDILKDKTAYVKGSKVTGTMPNQGTKNQTLTSQGASYTIPAGYHSGSGKVTANLTASTLDDTMISGEAIEETTGDYGYKVTVAVPAGYHNSQSVTKTFSKLFPAPDTPGTADKMLAGYKLYDGDGKLITGTMANNGSTGTTITTQGGTYSIPAGYTSGGTVKAQINSGTITSGAGTASATTTVAPGNVTIAKTTDGNASTGTVTTTKPTSGYYVATKATAAANTTGATSSITGTVAAPTVGTAGYVSSSDGTKNTNTVSGTATAKTSAKDSSVTYIPLTSGTLSAADSSISGGSFTPTLTYDSANGNFKFGGSKAATGTAYAKASAEGYVTSAQNTSKSLSATVSATGTLAKVGTGATISGTTTKAPTLARTAKPSGDTWVDAASGSATTTKPTSGPYVQIDAAANTGTLTATPKVTSAGYGDTTNYSATAATATVGAAKATTAYVPITTTSASVSGKTVSYGTGWITGGSKSVSDGAISAADSSISGGSFTPTLTYDSTNSNFKFGGSKAVSGTAYAKVTTNGYLTSSNNTSKSLSATVSATGTVNKVATGVDITGTTTKKPVISRTAKPSGDAWTDAASGAATTTKPTSGVYVQVNTAANTGTLTATPKVTSAGYGTTTSGQYGATAGTATVGASASDSTYVPITTATLPTASSSTASGTLKATIGRSTSDQYINIPVGYNTVAVNYKVSAVANGSATTPATSVSPGAGTGSVASSTGVVTIKSAQATKSVTPTVSAGYVSSGTAGTITVPATTFTYQLPTTKAAATITPGTSNQTIAAGTYLTGTQTIAGDADLVAGNIKNGVQIFGVTGTLVSSDFGVCNINTNETVGVCPDIKLSSGNWTAPASITLS